MCWMVRAEPAGATSFAEGKCGRRCYGALSSWPIPNFLISALSSQHVSVSKSFNHFSIRVFMVPVPATVLQALSGTEKAAAVSPRFSLLTVPVLINFLCCTNRTFRTWSSLLKAILALNAPLFSFGRCGVLSSSCVL